MNGNMVYMIYATLIAAVLLNVDAKSFYHRNDELYDEDQQNSLSPLSDGRTTAKSTTDLMKHFVRITSSTEGVINVKQGEPFELECVAVGSYSPSLDWYKDGVRVTDGEDNNYISRFDVTRGIIRYIVDCAQPKHSGSYSCEAVTGTVTASSPQQVRVHVSHKMSPRLMKSGGVCRQDQQLPRITRYSPVVMQNIGTDVKLVCRTQGFPRPDVYWTDKSGNILDTSAGSRFKILDSGDLIIKSVRWPDMGNYMCAAENRFGKDITSTFLYPMMEESKDEN